MSLRRLILALALACPPSAALAQTGQNVLLVVNDGSPDSTRIGDYYQQKRSLDSQQVVHLAAPVADAVTRADYERLIEAPVAQWLTRHGLQDQILYIVLTKGVPLRIVGTGGLNGTISSVDSELTLLYRRMVGTRILPAGRIENPYFLEDRPLAEAKPFTRTSSDLYFVTRLDGFTVDDVLRLIDRATSPVRTGQIVLDQKATVLDRGGDAWLQSAADRLSTSGHGDMVVLEKTRALASTSAPVLGYFSWGSNDPANQLRRSGLQFVNGAIGGMFVSTDGRTFKEPGADWKPALAGSTTGGQSLAGDLIRDGITGVSAHVAEPYLDSIVRPQILFPAYLAGFNLAESFYLAMPFLSWQDIVIGDPLCAPFRQTALRPDEIHAGVDAETTLPKLFSERRLAILARGELKTEALKLALKASALEARGATAPEVDAVLTQATDIEPRLVDAQLRLALAHESKKEYDEAIARYRAVVSADPNNAIGLNNLAFALADRKGAAKEALPFAMKAYRLAAQAPLIADTVGWVYHLLGDDKSALPYIDRAATGAASNAEIRLHAAVVHAALGNKARAAAELEAALRLDAALGDRPEVKSVREKIK